MSDLFASSAISALQQSLDFHLARQALLSSNVANAETPGYRSLDLSFDVYLAEAEEAAANASSTSGEGESEVFEMAVFDSSVGSPKNDGNTVSLENQMAKISANTIRYNAAAEILSRRLATLKYAASDGTRR